MMMVTEVALCFSPGILALDRSYESMHHMYLPTIVVLVTTKKDSIEISCVCLLAPHAARI